MPTLNYLLLLVGILALLIVGSTALSKAIKVATRSTPKEVAIQASIAAVISALAGLATIFVAICLLFRLAKHFGVV